MSRKKRPEPTLRRSLSATDLALVIFRCTFYAKMDPERGFVLLKECIHVRKLPNFSIYRGEILGFPLEVRRNARDHRWRAKIETPKGEVLDLTSSFPSKVKLLDSVLLWLAKDLADTFALQSPPISIASALSAEPAAK